LRRIICLPTIRRSRCSIPVAAAPRPDGFGCTHVTSDRGADPRRRQPSLCLRLIARASVRRRIWNSSREFSTSTATPASSGCRHAAMSSWPPVGRIRGATSTNSSRQTPLQLRPRRCGELVSFMPSRRASAVSPRRSEWPSGGRFPSRLSKVWVEQQLSRAPRRGKLADAIRYALSRWDGLTRFLHDGRIELDTNPVERAIRPVALGRKNHLFAGSDEGGARWATLCSLIETAKMNNVEPYAYLHDVLRRMVDGHPINRLDELLPWNWQPAEFVKT
jgi:Transposase IS66 family/IS66 C-terminal element